MAGLAILLSLPPGPDDVAIARRDSALGIAPTRLSPWYSAPELLRPGLIMSVTNLSQTLSEPACAALDHLLTGTDFS